VQTCSLKKPPQAPHLSAGEGPPPQTPTDKAESTVTRVQPNVQPQKQSAQSYMCNLCQKTFKLTLADFGRHYKMHESGTPGVLRCSYWRCFEVTFFSAEDLKKHMRNHATQDGAFKHISCDSKDCAEEFESAEGLKEHKSEAHSSSSLSCHVCGKLFQRKSDLDKHILTPRVHFALHQMRIKQE
jgi:hypothetical protein